MAELVTIRGEQYTKRNPLGVLGLSFITIGIYFFVWYYKINKEICRFGNDQTMSPTRSLMAMIFGWLIIVPPFIAMYNTAKHLQTMESHLGVRQTVEPSLAVILVAVFSIGKRDLPSGTPESRLGRGLGGRSPSPTPPAPLPPAPKRQPLYKQTGLATYRETHVAPAISLRRGDRI